MGRYEQQRVSQFIMEAEKKKKKEVWGIMQVEIISRSWDGSGVCIIRSVWRDFSYSGKVNSKEPSLWGGKNEPGILPACFVLTSKQESK